MPKGDPDSLTLLPNKITDDQGRSIFFTLNFAGQLVTEDTNQVYTTQATPVRVAYQETNCLLDNPHPEQHPYFLTHGWLGQTQTMWYGQNASKQNIQRIMSQNNYGYDTMGQRLSNAVGVQLTNADGSGQVDGSNNPIMSSRTETYTYDDLNRLSTVDYGDGQTQSYGFDPMGNRLQKTDSSTGTTNSVFDAANRLTSTTGTGASTYSNDTDGNTLTGGGRTNTWDSQNRLVTCAFGSSTTTNTYGADGLRRSSTVNGVTTYYVYDGSTLIREMHKNVQTGALYSTATYLTGPRGPEYRRDDTATELDSQGKTVSKCRWYVYDGLGSVVGEVDPSGNMTSSPKYDVYGLVRANPGTASSAMGFVGGLGHLSEASTGLIYMRARYYDPSLGRFASEDPSGHASNWFIYCGGNPINEADASGKIPIGIARDILGLLRWAGAEPIETAEGMTELSAVKVIFQLDARIAAMRMGGKSALDAAYEAEGKAYTARGEENDAEDDKDTIASGGAGLNALRQSITANQLEEVRQLLFDSLDESTQAAVIEVGGW